MVSSRDGADISSGSDGLEKRTGDVNDLVCSILVRMRGRAASRLVLASSLRSSARFNFARTRVCEEGFISVRTFHTFEQSGLTLIRIKSPESSF
jgi:hypothetical protein